MYGTQVGACPHPQLALGAHVQFMVAGMIGILAGLVLNDPNLCKLNDSPILLLLIQLGNWTLSTPSVVEAFAAFKGLGMPLVKSSSLVD